MAVRGKVELGQSHTININFVRRSTRRQADKVIIISTVRI